HKVPFLVETKGHQDWDWLLRATTLEDVGVEFVHQPLSIWDFRETSQSLSRTIDWQYSFDWIQSKRDLVTPRAYSSFILAEVSSRAAKARQWKAFFPLLWEALRKGAPQPNDLFLYLGMWLIPPQLRIWLRTLLLKDRRALST
ncbi:MAG TPA: glycosyl transferase, partial [Cyanobacteria bacterium UBA8553]|nr:glycosyl transferase [Cyanobacteria bacterium UBA8553]